MTKAQELQDSIGYWDIQRHPCEFLQLAERAEAGGHQDVATRLATSARTLDLIARACRNCSTRCETRTQRGSNGSSAGTMSRATVAVVLLSSELCSVTAL